MATCWSGSGRGGAKEEIKEAEIGKQDRELTRFSRLHRDMQLIRKSLVRGRVGGRGATSLISDAWARWARLGHCCVAILIGQLNQQMLHLIMCQKGHNISPSSSFFLLIFSNC